VSARLKCDRALQLKSSPLSNPHFPGILFGLSDGAATRNPFETTDYPQFLELLC
jgi:hypothetical protein